MSLFALASLKGAPGVTTLACLVAATWPLDRRVVVAECDPFGGDLAARFELSTARGCLSLATAARRDPEAVVADPHMQRLPGGLEVLVGGSSSEIALAQSVTRANVNQAVIAAARSVDVVADLGRMAAPYEECRQLLQAAEAVGVVIGPDQAAVAHAAEQGEMLTRLCGDRISLMVVGRGTSRSRDIEVATGLRVSAEVPHDPAAAAVASGTSSGARRLARSVLVKSARRIADSFASLDKGESDCLDDRQSSDQETAATGQSGIRTQAVSTDSTGSGEAGPRLDEPEGPTTLKVLP
jgi:MinD-like ATPase involved in chromosome partitioning or flagellar assembly